MPKYKFADIAYNITDKKMPEPGDEDLYIGLEHLDSGSLRVTRWGSDVELVGQKLCMKKGDILFGRRNTYLRRAAIAPHDGIFSAHGMIFRPNTNVMDPDFFPFFISSDYFMDAAIRISVGSLSPTVNWKTLKELEFYLPDLEQQRKTSEILAAANETKEAYQDLLAKTDELVKSQFIEMFGDPGNSFKYQVKQMTDLCEIIDGDRGKNYPRDFFDEGYCLFLNAKNVTQKGFAFNENQFITKERDELLRKGKLIRGDIVLTTRGTIGNIAYYSNDVCYEHVRINSGMVIIRPDHTQIVDEFFVCQLRMLVDNIKSTLVSGSAQPQLPIRVMNNITMTVPPINKQRQYEEFAQQTDKSKFELKKAIENISELMKTILQQDLSC